MTYKLTWRRRWAQKILHGNAVMLPFRRSSWAAAMRAEAQHIDDDREVLTWALGCLRAGCAARLDGLRPRKILTLHSLAVAWIAMFIVSSIFNVSIALATRLRLQGMASAMGRLIEGFHYDRFVPFADAMPLGLFVVMGTVVVVFGVSLFLSLRRHPAAFATFCCAVALSVATWLYQLGIPAYVQAMSSQHRWRIGICFAMTMGVLSVLGFYGALRYSSIQQVNGRQL
jgi:hypothetical protein